MSIAQYIALLIVIVSIHLGIGLIFFWSAGQRQELMARANDSEIAKQLWGQECRVTFVVKFKLASSDIFEKLISE